MVNLAFLVFVLQRSRLAKAEMIVVRADEQVFERFRFARRRKKSDDVLAGSLNVLDVRRDFHSEVGNHEAPLRVRVLGIERRLQCFQIFS